MSCAVRVKPVLDAHGRHDLPARARAARRPEARVAAPRGGSDRNARVAEPRRPRLRVKGLLRGLALRGEPRVLLLAAAPAVRVGVEALAGGGHHSR